MQSTAYIQTMANNKKLDLRLISEYESSSAIICNGVGVQSVQSEMDQIGSATAFDV